MYLSPHRADQVLVWHAPCDNAGSWQVRTAEETAYHLFESIALNVNAIVADDSRRKTLGSLDVQEAVATIPHHWWRQRQQHLDAAHKRLVAHLENMQKILHCKDGGEPKAAPI